MCELVYRGVGASPQTRIVLFEHCVFFFKDELHIHFWSTKQVLKMFILPRMLTLLNIKYPKSRMCCQKTVVGKKFHFGTAQLMCENKLLGVVGGALGRLQVILSDSCHSYL